MNNDITESRSRVWMSQFPIHIFNYSEKNIRQWEEPFIYIYAINTLKNNSYSFSTD